MPKNSRLSKREDPYYQAQAILSRRDHSETEVRQKLKRKRFTEAQVSQVIAVLKEKDLINDERFARAYVESILLGKAVGPRWLNNKLRQKQIAPTIITAVLAELVSPDQETTLIPKAVRSWRRHHPAGTTKELTQFLLSRGFSYEAVASATDKLRNLS